MKIYRVDVSEDTFEGKSKVTHLVRAESLAAARNHVYRVVSTRVANQDDMLLAVGDGALEIEAASEKS